VPLRPLLLLIAIVSPLAILGWLLATPGVNQPIASPVEHFVITTNVSVITLLVAVLTARAALQLRHYPTLLIAIGFMTMAGIFAVHGLSTPGSSSAATKRPMPTGGRRLRAARAARVGAVLRDPVHGARRLARSACATARPVGRGPAGLGAYAIVALVYPAWFGGIARWMLVSAGSYADYDPSTYGYGPVVHAGRRWVAPVRCRTC
jgi:hypothetical protein